MRAALIILAACTSTPDPTPTAHCRVNADLGTVGADYCVPDCAVDGPVTFTVQTCNGSYASAAGEQHVVCARTFLAAHSNSTYVSGCCVSENADGATRWYFAECE
jgi:hypothetical protein